MKKIIKLVILCSIFMQFAAVKAQPHISVDTLLGFPGQTLFNESINFYVVLRNHDSTVYQESVYIAFRRDTIYGSFGGPLQTHIDSGSTDTLFINGFVIDTAVFKMGGNVVVVWPVSSGGTQIMVADTFNALITITGYAGIAEGNNADKNNNVFPVPANDMIFLPRNIAENGIEHVRIFDILGQQKYFSAKYSGNIDVSELSNGIYFAEIKERNNTPKVLKFVISR